jgi:hypothetical protein
LPWFHLLQISFEKFVTYANKIPEDGIKYNELTAEHPAYQDIIDAVKDDSIQTLGYFLPPTDLFHTMAQRGERSKGTGKVLFWKILLLPYVILNRARWALTLQMTSATCLKTWI